jgi:hypothetical protein
MLHRQDGGDDMRTFCAIICAAVAGLVLFGAAWALMSHDGMGAMLAGLIACAGLMSAALAFRRPTETERHEKRLNGLRAQLRQPLSCGWFCGTVRLP